MYTSCWTCFPGEPQCKPSSHHPSHYISSFQDSHLLFRIIRRTWIFARLHRMLWVSAMFIDLNNYQNWFKGKPCCVLYQIAILPWPRVFNYGLLSEPHEVTCRQVVLTHVRKPGRHALYQRDKTDDAAVNSHTLTFRAVEPGDTMSLSLEKGITEAVEAVEDANERAPC